MIKELRLQLFKMAIAFSLLVLLAVWQFDFVMVAINSNIFLNSIIISVFIFGAVMAFIEVFSIENEIIAFQGLKEGFEDTRNVKEKEKIDPLWRHYRANEPAIIYKKPKILASAHQLVYEQIARFRRVIISPTNVAALMDSVDARLSDKKSSLQFIAGLLIFLGLIGTFVGLMGTLASVSGILGSIDLSGDASSSVQGLMDQLKLPLAGMATGFSSSLLGLITSLTLSIMSRFAGAVFGSLHMNLEEWLTAVSQLCMSEEHNEKAVETKSDNNHFGTKELGLMLNTARHTISANSRTREQISAIGDVLKGVIHHNQHQDARQNQMLIAIARLIEQNSAITKAVHHYGKEVESHIRLNQNIASIEERIALHQSQTQHLLEDISADLTVQKVYLSENEAELRKEETQILDDLKASLATFKTETATKAEQNDEMRSDEKNAALLEDQITQSEIEKNDLKNMHSRLTNEFGQMRPEEDVVTEEMEKQRAQI